MGRQFTRKTPSGQDRLFPNRSDYIRLCRMVACSSDVTQVISKAFDSLAPGERGWIDLQDLGFHYYGLRVA